MADPKPSAPAGSWTLWGVDLSPFALKVEAMLRLAELPFRWLPAQGSFLEGHRAHGMRLALVSGLRAPTWPPPDPLDEFPLVPFLFGPGGERLHDSTAIADWLDRSPLPTGSRWAPLLCPEKATTRLAMRMVDEALDEVGLYLVHHNRWVVSASDNDAGVRLAQQIRPLLGPAARLVEKRFALRQVRRLPYLFSVADPDEPRLAGLPTGLIPPARTGFPPTHRLLEEAFAQLLVAIEPIFANRPFLFGERFGVADASLYGQLGMNRSDPSAWKWIEHEAPATAAWVERLAAGDFTGHRPDAAYELDALLEPLLDWVSRAFVPLMLQNQAAGEHHRSEGVTLFNEVAFDAGAALYDGELLGHPFRSVTKTFQIRVWRDLVAAHDALGLDERGELARRHLRFKPPGWR